MTHMVPAHPLVRAEWPHIVEVPRYDFEVVGEDVHLGVYVRRVATEREQALVGLINHVVVAPLARRHGRGSQAVIDALAWLGRGDVPFAHVHCEPMRADFYEWCGFVRVDNFPAPDHNGPRISMIANRGDRNWLFGPVEYVEPW